MLAVLTKLPIFDSVTAKMLYKDYDSVQAELVTKKTVTSAQKRIRNLTLVSLGALVLILALSLCVFLHHLNWPRDYKDSSLLGGSGGLAVFAIAVALSAYLRSVAGTADEKREKIRAGKVPLFPAVNPDNKDGRTACTEQKLKALDQTFENLQVAANFLIFLTLLLAIRLSAESVSRLSSYFSTRGQLAFRAWDLVILEWLTLAIAALGLMHWFARNRDERIRVAAEACRLSEKDEKLLAARQ
jgi:hypothetical protein